MYFSYKCRDYLFELGWEDVRFRDIFHLDVAKCGCKMLTL